MTFEDKIRSLALKAEKVAPTLETEEATKNALIMPFIAALGYDVFDPEEVVPEFTADVGIKKGEKVDYALRQNGEVVILIEAKKAKASLGNSHSSQLFRYFTVTKARIAILTNGIVYRFFSDLEEPNKMDEKPFLELDLLNLRENLLSEVAKLSKDQFDLNNLLSTAVDLKSIKDIRSVLETWFETPDDELLKLLFQRVTKPKTSRLTSGAKERFSSLVVSAFNQVLSDRVGDRLRNALHDEEIRAKEETVIPPRGIVTTEEELAGFNIIQLMLRDLVDAPRITWRDAKTFFSVLVDGKVLCRLYFNKSQKFVAIYDSKREHRMSISDVSGIWSLKEQIREAVSPLLKRHDDAPSVGSDDDFASKLTEIFEED